MDDNTPHWLYFALSAITSVAILAAGYGMFKARVERLEKDVERLITNQDEFRKAHLDIMAALSRLKRS